MSASNNSRTGSPQRIFTVQKNQYVQCPNHRNFEMTNICLECKEPLCPECIYEHTNIHQANKTLYSIETIHKVRDEMIVKLDFIKEKFLIEKERISGTSSGRQNLHVKEAIQKIQEARDKIFSLLEGHFKTLEENVKRSSQNVPVAHPGEYNRVDDKLNKIISDIDKLHQRLISPDYVDPLLKAFDTKFQEPYESIRDDVDSALKMNIHDHYDVIVEEAEAYQILTQIPKYIKVITITPEMQTRKAIDNSLNVRTIRDDYNRYTRLNESTLSTGNRPRLNQNSQYFRGFSGGSHTPPRNKIPNQAGTAAWLGKHEAFSSSAQSARFKDNYFQETSPAVHNENLIIQNSAYFHEEKYSNCFEENLYRKNWLTYFQEGMRKLMYFDLIDVLPVNRKPRPAFNEMDLKIGFDIAYDHRSLMTPRGDLYLIGGKKNKSGTLGAEEALNECYQMDFKGKNFLKIRPMGTARYNHSVVYMNNFIFVIGGMQGRNKYLNSCEKLDLTHKQWVPIASTLEPSSGSSVCAYKNTILLKFGGKCDDYTCLNKIERYDPRNDCWFNLNFHVADYRRDVQSFLGFPLFGQAIQINEKEIFIFGGRTDNGVNKVSSFLFTSDLDLSGELSSTSTQYDNRVQRLKPDLILSGYLYAQPVIFMGSIFAIVSQTSQKQYNTDYRKVFITKGEIWKELIK